MKKNKKVMRVFQLPEISHDATHYSELIDWQQQKTNDDYMAELSDSSFKNDFGKATLLYDYVW